MEGIIINLMLFVIISAIIIVFCYFIFTRVNELKWEEYSENKFNWDQHQDLKLFKLSDKKMYQKLDKGKGFKLSLPKYESFSELCIYNYPDFSMVRTIPYPHEIKLSCPEHILPGKYVFILRCRGKGLSEWSTKQSFKLQKIKQANIAQTGIPMNIGDSENYDALGRYYQSLASNREDFFVDSLISVEFPVAPLSLYIKREHIDFELKENQSALIIVPNRVRTMNCYDTVMINNSIVESNTENGFNSYEIIGREHKRVIVDQYIYGNISDEILSFYVYIFEI